MKAGYAGNALALVKSSVDKAARLQPYRIAGKATMLVSWQVAVTHRQNTLCISQTLTDKRPSQPASPARRSHKRRGPNMARALAATATVDAAGNAVMELARGKAAHTISWLPAD